MAFCTSCGSEVADSASFCTSCGQPMTASTASAQPAAVDTMVVCSACGAKVDAASSFCTGCGKRMTADSPIVAAQAVPAEATAAAVAPAATSSVAAAPTPVETAFHPTPVQPSAEAAATPQLAAQSYAAPSDYQPPQPGGGKFRAVVLVLLLVIVVGACGGWYFLGVETVIVCSPPDVTVFLDDKELTPASYGRYVVPHLSRKTHLLKVQSPGFADTIQRLDFPLTSLHEWVNIRLVSSRQIRR